MASKLHFFTLKAVIKVTNDAENIVLFFGREIPFYNNLQEIDIETIVYAM